MVPERQNQSRDNGVLGWQWHQLDNMQTICTLLQTDNHTNTSSLIRQEAQLSPRDRGDASSQLKSCQLPRNSAETTYKTSPDQIDGMKLEI